MRIITIAEVVLLSNIRNNGVYLISSYSIGRKKGKKEERVEERKEERKNTIVDDLFGSN